MVCRMSSSTALRFISRGACSSWLGPNAGRAAAPVQSIQFPWFGVGAGGGAVIAFGAGGGAIRCSSSRNAKGETNSVHAESEAARCFDVVFEGARAFREAEAAPGEGLFFWKQVRPILERFDEAIVDEGWRGAWVKQLADTYVNDQMEERCPEYESVGTTKEMIEHNHFMLQVLRIPTQEKLTLRKLCQVALNLGQLSAHADLFEGHFRNIFSDMMAHTSASDYTPHLAAISPPEGTADELARAFASFPRPTPVSKAHDIWELKGQYYQVIGHAWDHEVKEFKVVYRPLYHCEAKPGSFEAHYLAVSHFSRWEEKFRKVNLEDKEERTKIPEDARKRILEGPFWMDPQWKFSDRAVVDDGNVNRSGHGKRSCEGGPSSATSRL